jgi:membrane-associated phospholipid phosphatase
VAVSWAGPRVRLPLAGAAVALVVFALLAIGAHDGFGWDDTVSDLVADIAPVSDEEVHVDPFIDVLTLAVGLLTAAVVVVLLRRRRPREAIFPVAAVIGASLANLLVKVIVDRPAIEDADGSGASFPSGTATWSMAVAAALVLLAPRSRRLVAAVAGGVFVIGLAGVIAWEEWHYPSDILAGWCLALGWVLLLWAVLLRAQRSNAPASGAL